MSDEIRTILHDALAAVDAEIGRTGVDDPMQWRVRRAYLDRVLVTVDEPRTRKNVFVSYSKNEKRVFNEVRNNLTGAGLEVLTGFDQVPDATKVIETVLTRLNSASIYVGILTPDIDLASPQKGPAAAPGAWLMQELGMALALQKQFVLMIHKHIHPDFWRKIVAERQHLVFDDRNYKKVAKDVCTKVLALRQKRGE